MTGRDGSLGEVGPAVSEVTDDGLGWGAAALTRRMNGRSIGYKGNSLCEFLG